MKKTKIPDELVREYLRLADDLRKLEKTVKPLKEKILEYIEKGFTHPGLLVTEVERRTIPWQKIVQELVTEKYAGDEEKIKAFYKRLDKRFQPEPIAPRLQASGK